MTESKLRPLHYPREGTLTAGTDCIRIKADGRTEQTPVILWVKGWGWAGLSSLLTRLPVVICEVHAGEPCSWLPDVFSCLWSCVGYSELSWAACLTCLKGSGLGSWKMLGSNIITRVAFGGWWLHLKSLGLWHSVGYGSLELLGEVWLIRVCVC